MAEMTQSRRGHKLTTHWSSSWPVFQFPRQ